MNGKNFASFASNKVIKMNEVNLTFPLSVWSFACLWRKYKNTWFTIVCRRENRNLHGNHHVEFQSNSKKVEELGRVKED